jgi:hypothetical protein
LIAIERRFEYDVIMDFGGMAVVDAALDALSVSLDHLVKLVEDSGLETFNDAQLVGFQQGFERVRNRLPLVDHAVIGAVLARDLPAKLAQSTPQRMLAALLRLSAGEASRRVRAAEAVGPRTSMLGQPLEPVGPIWRRPSEAGKSRPNR